MALPDTQVVALTAAGKRRLQQRLERTRSEVADLDLLIKSGDATQDHVTLRRLLDEHVGELARMLELARDIASVDEDPSIVEVGDGVDVAFDDGETATYALVHPAEVSVGENHISPSSPMGRALLGRRLGDRVDVQAPAGTYAVTVVARRRLA